MSQVQRDPQGSPSPALNRLSVIGVHFGFGSGGPANMQEMGLPGWLFACSTEDLPKLLWTGISLHSASQRPGQESRLSAGAQTQPRLGRMQSSASSTKLPTLSPRLTTQLHQGMRADTVCGNDSLISVATLAKIFWER